MHYLDNSATTPVLPAAAARAAEVMTGQFGNPSSLHRLGLEAAHILRDSRREVARAMGAQPEEVYFTSGGTESINTAILGAAHRRKKGHIVTTAIEHAATLQSCRRLEQEGYEVTYLTPDREGHVSAEDFEAALREDTLLASVMLVNNEVGTVQPIARMAAALARRCPEALFHVDAVQGFFRVPLAPVRKVCHLLSVSGHKVGAPKGIGALYVRKGVRIVPHQVGGGQESGLRAGTEPLPNIAALAAACAQNSRTTETDYAHVEGLRTRLLAGLSERLPWAAVNGQADIPHIVNLSLPGCRSEVILRVLEGDEVYVSAGSACSRGKESPVLRAMGLEKARIESAIRVSFAPWNTEEDVDALLAGLEKAAAMLRRG